MIVADIESFIRSLGKRLLHRPPFRIGRCGSQSRILKPRLVDGAENIEVGDRTLIREHSWLCTISEYAGESFQPRLVIGNDVYVGRYACIVASQLLVIESGSVLSEHVYISDNSHGLSPARGLIMKQKLVTKGDVRIGRNCFIGYRACILPGVQLGEHCVVGANSVVTKSFPSFSMVAGIPARLIRKYSCEKDAWIAAEERLAEYADQR